MSSRVDAPGCLGDDTIAAVLEGALGGDAARQARLHLADCAACRRLVSAAVEAGVGGQPDSTAAPVAATVSMAPIGQPDPVFPGAIVAGRFRIERPIGEGGMGCVFAARQLDLDRPVALKIIR